MTGGAGPAEHDASSPAELETEATSQARVASGDPGVEVPIQELPGALEALLAVAERPASIAELGRAVGHCESAIRAALDQLAQSCVATGRGLEVRQVAGGWRLYTAARWDDCVRRFLEDDTQTRLSKAALETLAIVAYRQPVTRAQIAAIRGVNVDGVVRTLLARELLEVTGEDPSSGAAYYGTTQAFLLLLGLDSLSDLPNIAHLLPEIDPDSEFLSRP